MRYPAALILLLLMACTAQRPIAEMAVLPAEITPDYTLILIGDAGHAGQHPAVMELLTAQLDATLPARTGVLFLGDNVYPAGLPAEDGAARNEALQTLHRQLDAVAGFTGEVWWIAGNHDQAGKDGQQRLRQQEMLLEQQRDDVTAFLPGYPCPGPYVEVLPQQLILIAFNSQAYMDGINACTHNHDSMLAALPAYVSAYPGLPVVIAAHHPLRSDGPHGGRFGWRPHLFPLTDIVDWAYLPLPVVGTAYVAGRKWLGHPQDLSSAKYRQWRQQLTQALEMLPPALIVSGHDHILQVLQLSPHWQLISGTGSQSSKVRPRRHSVLAVEEQGFLKVLCYPDGSIFVEAWSTDAFEARGRLVGRIQLM